MVALIDSHCTQMVGRAGRGQMAHVGLLRAWLKRRRVPPVAESFEVLLVEGLDFVRGLTPFVDKDGDALVACGFAWGY